MSELQTTARAIGAVLKGVKCSSNCYRREHKRQRSEIHDLFHDPSAALDKHSQLRKASPEAISGLSELLREVGE